MAAKERKEMQMINQPWYKSYTVWISLAGQLFGLLVLIGVIDVTQSEVWLKVVIAVGQLLVTVGILNNPNRNNVIAMRAAIKSHNAARKSK